MSEEKDIKELVDRIIEDGVISGDEYDELLKTIHADGKIDQGEKDQIDRVYKLIKDGTITIEND